MANGPKAAELQPIMP